MAFYADNSSDNFMSYTGGTVNVDYSKGVSNDREEDAFIGTSTKITVTGPVSETVTLSRPFAQLNWGTDDLDSETVKHMATLTASVKVTSGLYSSMNILTGDVSNPVQGAVTFPNVHFSSLPTETFPVSGYSLIVMNYLLTGKGTIDC